ncbi:MAG: hypothetical protein KIS67_24500 [Verrucomicrobiae bacterium]|nr:hypothetical protein [Verrucomicrobiae bacterium]
MSTRVLNHDARQRWVRGFIHSAGAILLFLATALFLVNATSPADWSPTNVPILRVPVSRLFWFVGGIGMAVGLICLLAKNSRLPMALVSVMATSLLAARIGGSALGLSHGFKGYLGPLADAFGVPASTADGWLIATSGYLLLGCLVSWRAVSEPPPSTAAGEPNRKAA